MSTEGSSNRRLSAILFADIVGYTAMMQSDEGLTMSRLKRYQDVLKSKVANHQGEVIKNYGDGSLCLFSSVLDAVNCGKEVQEELMKEPKVPLRIGLHIGDVMFRDDDVYGNALNISSRIESMGSAGSVLMSKDVYEKVKNQSSFSFKSLGDFQFKNVEETIEVFALTNGTLVLPSVEKEKTRETAYAKYILLPLALVALGLFADYFGLFRSSGNDNIEPANIEQSIAVLPLRNLNTKNENLDYFSDGVTQEIIDELVKVSSFQISAFSTTILYKNSTEPPSNIAEELKVDYLVRGSSRTLADSVKLSINLIEPSTNKIVWNEVYMTHLEDAPSIQGKIARSVAEELDVKLSPKEILSLNTPATQNGQAFRLFLQAKAEVHKLTMKGMKNARVYLEDAIELDPNYAQAHTLLAWTYTLGASSLIWPENMSSDASIEFATSSIEKSIELNPESSDIYLVRGKLNVYSKNKIQDAKDDVDYALELNSWPRVPTNYCICTVVSTYVAKGAIEEGKKLAKLGEEVDPGNVFIYWDQANLLTMEGNHEEAQINYKKAVEAFDISFFNLFMGWSFFNSVDYENAEFHLLKATRQDSVPLAMAIAYLSNLYWNKGDREKSNLYKQQLLDRLQSGEHHLNLPLAMIFSNRSEKNIALDYLEKALDLSEYGVAVMTSLDPIFSELHSEERFINLRKRMQYYD